MSPERLLRLRPEDLDTEQRALYRSIVEGPRASGVQHFSLTDDEGCLEGPFGIMLHAPGVGAALQELGAAIRYRTGLSDRVREVAILQVAVATDCSFEWYAHERVGRAAGLTDDELEAVRAGAPRPLDTTERAAVDVVAALLGAGTLSAEQHDAAASVLGTTALVELIALVGYYRLLAQALNAFGVGPPVDD